MADRFWVGGAGTWDTTSTTNWSATSGGPGGASAPTSADNVFFDQASTYTVTVNGSVCNNFSVSAGNPTFNGAAATLTISGSINWPFGISGSVNSSNVLVLFNSTVTGNTIVGGNGRIARVTFNGVGGGWTMTADWTTQNVTFTNGTFNSNGFALSFSTGTVTVNGGTVSFSSSTVTLNNSVTALTVSSGSVDFGSSSSSFQGSNPIARSGGTISTGTSTISFLNPTITLPTAITRWYNVAFTSAVINTITIVQANTFNNLTFSGRTTAGIAGVILNADQTINGTLTLSAGTNATMRTFVRSNTLGTTRTLTCAAFSGTDADFRDITIAGAAAPVSGTRLGDCKGNSGITFDSAKTIYWNAPGALWRANAWATSPGGTTSLNNFPLAQDTAVFTLDAPPTGNGVTIDAAYNIGTIDMSARTSNTMTLATGTQTPTIYGNWINGTGTTLTGTGSLTFAGRGSQTITSAGKTFTQSLTINTPGGSVTLQDALTLSAANTTVFLHTQGTFDANGYNVTLSATTNGRISTDGAIPRTLAVGSGTWTLAASGTPWSASSSLTVTGTGTISLTSASAKTFAGGGIQTYPTLNQGGTGTLTVTGSNKFANITNTAIGSVLFTGGTTNEFTSFNLNGTSTAARLTLGSTNTTQAILIKPSAWLMGANSTDGGNNTGLSFTAGGGIDYLSVSYINGQVVAPAVTYQGNFFAFF